jgi:hypothetical protein
MGRIFWAVAVTAVGLSSVAHAEEPATATVNSQSVTLSPSELFSFAEQARAAGDFATAETAYRALATNPDIELRCEARFRLGMMLADQQKKYREAAIEFRKILDEKPKAARVRLELARMQAMLGNTGAAERELRAAEAAGLPPEVEQMVRFYANALNAQKPIGGSLEVAIAPDSNINRATKSNTLGTVIGDFTLDDNAKAHSGIGLSLRGQGYFRTGIDQRATLLVRLSASADAYRASEFDDFIVSLQAGPEYVSGKDRINLSAGPAWRWYGTDPYRFTIGGQANWQHPIGKRAQLRVDGGIAHVDNRRNDLQDGDDFTLSAAVDRAISARFGGGVQFIALREATVDPGYATTSGGVNGYLYRELGQTTAVLNLGYNHLEADARLFLYPERRRDDRFSASISGTFRTFRVGSFAPLARLRWERNKSTIEIYDYKRIAAEVGVTAAF